MDFYFTNRQFELLEIISTSNATEIVLADEEDKLSVENGNRTLTGTIYFDKEQSKQVKECAELGNYILFHDSKMKKDVWMTIVEKDHRPKSGRHEFVAEDAGLDLLNELLGPFKATKAYPISYYIENFTFDSGFELGFNEIPNLTRKLEWESEDMTALARLVSVANQFDNAEIDFSFDVDGTTVLKKYINVYKKRGKDNRETYYVNVDIDEIAVKGDIYDLGTAIKAFGGTPEGKNSPINLIGYKWTDPDGRYIIDSNGILRDKENGAKWSRLLPGQANPHGAYILRRKTYETTSQKTLLDNALRELKKISEPAINYEIENLRLSETTSIGDTIYLVDENEEVYLSARLLEISYQYSTESSIAVLGDYLIKDSGVSQKLIDAANELREQANRKLYDVKLEATSTTLINENSSVKITAKVYDGTLDVSTNFSEYKWSRMDSAGVIDPDWSKVTNTVTLKADDQPLWTYICEVSKLTEDSSYVIGVDRVTIVNLADESVGKPGEKGEDGKTPYFHTAYANNASGKDFSTSDATGRSWIGTYSDFEPLDSEDYRKYTWQVIRGIKSTKDTYARSASGTVFPESGWQDDIPDVPAGEYLWKKTETTYTDDTKDSTFINTKMGEKGTDGKGIMSDDIEYQVSTSGTTAPQGTWLEKVPSVPANQFLWTRTTITYTDNTTSTSYSVGRMGADGSDAQLLYLTATAETMNFDAENNPKTTQIITISAKLQNVTGTATFKAIPYIGNVAQTAINLGGSGNERTLTSSQWTNKQWTMIAITATLNGLTDTLSVTKVNDGKEGEPGEDGKTSYVHHAWAWSADGKDRFTIVYPNENLLKSTLFDSLSGFSGSHSSIKEFANDAPSGYTTNYTKNIYKITQGVGQKYGLLTQNLIKVDKVNVGDWMTVSAEVYIPTTLTTVGSAFYIGKWDIPSGEWINSSLSASAIRGKWTVIKHSFKVTDTSMVFGVGFGSGAQATQQTFWCAGYKVELGDTVTPLTPRPSDDYENAYPLYAGTYTDFSPTASTDPSKYTWARHVGGAGKDGENGQDGTGISKQEQKYQLTAQAVMPTDAWTSTKWLTTQPIPTDANKYLWKIERTTYTNPTSTKDIVTLLAVFGADGKTPYFHQAWANSKDGKVGFSTTISTDKAYLGTYTDFTAAGSTDPTKYNWIELVGALEIGGRNFALQTNDSKTLTATTTETYKCIDMYTVSNILKEFDLKIGDKLTFIYKWELTGVAANVNAGTFRVGSNVTPAWEYFNTDVAMGTNRSGVEVRTIILNANMITSLKNGTYWRCRWDNNKLAGSIKISSFAVFFGIGNRVWSPAPEDVEDRLTSLQTTATGIPKVFTQSNQPVSTTANPLKAGDQWWQMSNNKITAFKIYTGSAWVNQSIEQAILNIVSLNAVNINGSVINGSEFVSSYNTTGSGVTYNGELRIGTGLIRNEYEAPQNAIDGVFQVDRIGNITNSRNIGTGHQQYELTPLGLSLDDGAYSGTLTAIDVYRLNNTGEKLADRMPGGAFMTGDQTITPSKKLSECLNGWVIEWQGFRSGNPTNGDYTYTMIPKIHGTLHSGAVMSVLVVGEGGGIFRKILYVRDNNFSGHSNNGSSPANTAVLTAVYSY